MVKMVRNIEWFRLNSDYNLLLKQGPNNLQWLREESLMNVYYVRFHEWYRVVQI